MQYPLRFARPQCPQPQRPVPSVCNVTHKCSLQLACSAPTLIMFCWIRTSIRLQSILENGQVAFLASTGLLPSYERGRAHRESLPVPLCLQFDVNDISNSFQGKNEQMLDCLCGRVRQNWHRSLKITSLKSYSAASIKSCYMYTVWLQCVSPITGASHPKMKMSYHLLRHMLWLWNLFWKVEFWKIYVLLSIK